MKRTTWLLICLASAGCLTGPAEPESTPAGESTPPTILRLHGAMSDGIELSAVVWVSSSGSDCAFQRSDEAIEYRGLETLAASDSSNDILSRARREGGEYVLEIPWTWQTATCSFHASSVAINASTTQLPADALVWSVLRITKQRMGHSTNVADVGALSCRRDPFSQSGLACRRASGATEPDSTPETGLTFFSHVDEPDPSSADPYSIDIPLAVLERRASCQATQCARGCAPSEVGCMPSDCDPARDCAALTSFRQDNPVAIAAHGSIVSSSELVVQNATPATLTDLVLLLDYAAADELTITVSRGGARTVLGTLPPPAFGRGGQGEYHVPLDPRFVGDPNGSWGLEVSQRRQFFTGAVVSWGIDLYR